MIQQSFYTGHKRCHAIKFQLVTLPNGMKFHVSQPDSARRHDSILLSKSNILQKLEALEVDSVIKYRMHGDSAYAAFVPYLSSGELGPVRVVVEQDIGEAKQLFKFVTYQGLLRVREMKVATICFAALLLHDVYIPLNGSKVATEFNVPPPTLEDWTRGEMRKMKLTAEEIEENEDLTDILREIHMD